jgi:hypothetical protein
MKEDKLPEAVDEGVDDVPADNVWKLLTEEQRKKFKELTEKNEENLRYIG